MKYYQLMTVEEFDKAIKRYNDFKESIRDRYDYLSAIEIAKLNRSEGWGLTLRQCVDLREELYPG